MKTIPCKCTRCKHLHLESERVERPKASRAPGGLTMNELLCPRCSCRSFYDMTPQQAWCWSTGLIEFGDAMPADGPDGSGAILIATGPKSSLKVHVAALAREGRGTGAGQLLVPGVPEAETQDAKADALDAWLRWCGRGRKRGGVAFTKVPKGHAMKPAYTELVEWFPVEASMPDADETVLIALRYDDCGPTWLGYFDGTTWRSVDASAVDVTHWARMLAGPAVAHGLIQAGGGAAP